MLGHSDTKMTRHYARVLDKSIMRDMQVVNEMFAKLTASEPSPSPEQLPVADSVTVTHAAPIPKIIPMPVQSRRQASRVN